MTAVKLEQTSGSILFIRIARKKKHRGNQRGGCNYPNRNTTLFFTHKNPSTKNFKEPNSNFFADFLQ